MQKVQTIRVYALVVNKRNEVLLSDEKPLDNQITKFPGGGMEFNESVYETLHREFTEETGKACRVKEHFYTTDVAPNHFLLENHQIFAVYYLAEYNPPKSFVIHNRRFAKPDMKRGEQSYWWCPVDKLKPDIFTLPSDKEAAKRLKKIQNKDEQ